MDKVLTAAAYAALVEVFVDLDSTAAHAVIDAAKALKAFEADKSAMTALIYDKLNRAYDELISSFELIRDLLANTGASRKISLINSENPETKKFFGEAAKDCFVLYKKEQIIIILKDGGIYKSSTISKRRTLSPKAEYIRTQKSEFIITLAE